MAATGHRVARIENEIETCALQELPKAASAAAVYTLLDIERGVPELWGSQYDVRALLNAGAVMRDGEIGELGDDKATVAINKNPPPRVTRTVL